MHSSVLQNDKYIEFSQENSVEIIALGRLDEGISKNDPKAAEYDAKDEEGKPVKYMVEYAGMTRDEMLALDHSKAATYNDTGKIPFTCIVDPYTEKEMQRFSGGQSAKTLMEAVATQKKVLNSEHGPSLSRGTLTKVNAETKRITGALEKAGVAKSMADYRKLEKSLAKEGDAIKKKIEPVLDAIVEAATKDLDEADAQLGAGEVGEAKKILGKLGSKTLAGTSLEARYKELMDKVAAAAKQ